MPDTIELKETPLSDEDIQRDYVNIKGAAQILSDVSEKTARRYLTEPHGVSVHTIEKIVNGGVGKLYRKTDVIAVAEALKVIPSVQRYETVTVRQSEGVQELPKDTLTEPKSLSVHECLLVSKTVQECLMGLDLEFGGEVKSPGIPAKLFVGTLIVGVLIYLCTAYFTYQTMKKDRASIIEALKTEFRIARLAQEIESKI